MPNKFEIIHNLKLELRKGTLVLGVLSQLFKQHYGYSLNETLNELGLSIDQNTLYPLLRRLEKQKILESLWDTSESRPRKYYIISEFGKEIYEELKREYVIHVDMISSLIK